jgi:hypothetical protein
MNPSTIVCGMKRNWTVWFSYVEYNPVSAGLAANPMPGLGRARGWQAKAPVPQLDRIAPEM